MDLGPWELLIILVVLCVPLVLIFVAVMLVTRANRQKGSAQFAEYSVPDQRRPLPPEAVTHFHHLIADRKKIQAIKEIRILTGLGLKEAKDLADAIEAGRSPHGRTPVRTRPRLQSRRRPRLSRSPGPRRNRHDPHRSRNLHPHPHLTPRLPPSNGAFSTATARCGPPFGVRSAVAT